MNAIARQIQISLITDEYNELITWFNNLWTNVKVIETSVYHNDGGELIYFHIINDKKQYVFYRDDKSERFWCNYNHYWSILESKFNLNYDDIQAITKLFVENSLNSSIATPIVPTNSVMKKTENALNNITND